jgi:DNA-binding SARP family transcriptional activator/tetratricopeptide (TPR) repeat protein
MRLELLGLFRAVHDGSDVEVGRRQERLLLALLALERGRVVSTSRLLDLIWDGAPPASARAAIHTYVARLRSSLRDTHTRIVSRGNGYVISDNIEVDALDMIALSAQADAASAADRAGIYRRALDLWRGPLLADLASEHLQDRIGRRFGELRLDCLARRAEALLDLGRPELVAAELADDVDGRLPGENLVRSQMIALYRTNRRAEALAIFDRVRREVADEYGLDLSPDLSDLQLAILRDDPALAFARPATHQPSTVPAAPNQLPRAVADFVGRASDLDRIDELFDQDPVGLVAITALGGMSGVGKTAVALEWAHEAGSRFPDGRFYVNLRGYDLEAPLPAIEALTHLIRALGQPTDSIPTDVDGAAAMYRALLADRRALVILDNARSAEQVRPLIPGTASSAVLVTSRDHLTGLVARDGARLHVLDVLPAPEAAELLARLVGRSRVDAEPDAAERLVAMVGHLPLAVRIIGAHLAARPDERLAAVVARFTSSRLPQLEVADDPRTNVRSLFQHSYDALDEPQRRLFRLFGVAPVIDITVPAAARLADLPEPAAQALLERLSDLSLLARTGSPDEPARFAFHDLVREFARGAAIADEPGPTREAAIGRLLDWYVETVRGAAETLHPAFVRLPYHRPGHPFPSDLAARAYLDAELANLTLVIPHARSLATSRPAWILADALRGYFWAYGHRHVWAQSAAAGLAAAEAAGDRAGQAAMYCSLGTLAERHRQARESLAHLRTGLVLSEAAGWDEGSASLLNNIGNALYTMGDVAEAAATLERAFDLNQRLGKRATSGLNLINLGNVRGRLGDLRRAADSLEQAVTIFRETGDRTALSVALHNYGNMRHRLGDMTGAVDAYRESRDLYRAVGNLDGEGLVASSLAALRRDQGRYEEAIELSHEAVQILIDNNEEMSVVMARNTLASVLLRQGEAREASAIYQESIADAERLGIPRPRAEALIGLARAQVRLGDLISAAASARSGLAIADEHGMPLVRAEALLAIAEAVSTADADEARTAGLAAFEIFRDAGAATSMDDADAVLKQIGDQPA